MTPKHIQRAIAQAKKDGHKGVEGFVGGIDNHNRYNKLLNDGKLEVFSQEYKIYDKQEGFSTCLLMRKPNLN